jgi:hypothetical protein
MDDLEFGNEYTPFGGFGLGGYIEGVERGGVANRLNAMLMNPEEKFFASLNMAFDKVDDYRSIDIHTRNLMAEFANKMPHMTFKNATAYILGCLASYKHRDDILNKNEVKKVFGILQYFKDTENISTSDVIRYARFAMLNGFVVFGEGSSLSDDDNSDNEEEDIYEGEEEIYN